MRALLSTGLLIAAAPALAVVSTPVTTITDPRSLESPANPNAKPVPLGDLSAACDVLSGLGRRRGFKKGRAQVAPNGESGPR